MFKVYTLRDRQSGLFGKPVFSLALGALVRELTDHVNSGRSDDTIVQHPEDFQLYYLGEFDDQKGTFSLLPLPDMVIDCGTLVRPRGAAPAVSGANVTAGPQGAAEVPST